MKTQQKKLALIFGVLGLAFIYAIQPYSLVWNRTASIPIGLYLSEKVSGTELHRGDLACFPYEPPAWAEPRTYFVKGLRLCKHVSGLPGDILTKDETGLWQVSSKEGNVRQIGPLLKADSKGQPLPQNALKEGALEAGEVLMSAPPKNSLDSRYLGPIAISKLNTRIYPLWTH